MKLENNVNVTNNQQELVTEKEQNNFLDSTLGKVIDSAIDVGLRMILPDFVEEGIIGVKDALIQGRFKGRNKYSNRWSSKFREKCTWNFYRKI